MSTPRPSRAWVVVGILALVAVHVVAIHHFASHLALPIAATFGVVVLVIAKHAGVFGALHDRFRRRS